MKTITPATPRGNTIFCDDVRLEMGGKLSLIGIYSGSINVHKELPIQLPKFAFVISYSERPGESSDPVFVRIFLPGDEDDKPSFEISVPVEQVRSKEPPPGMELEDPLITAGMQIVAAPLELKQEGLIKVRAYRGDLEIKLGAMRVMYTPQVDQTSPAENPI